MSAIKRMDGQLLLTAFPLTFMFQWKKVMSPIWDSLSFRVNFPLNFDYGNHILSGFQWPTMNHLRFSVKSKLFMSPNLHWFLPLPFRFGYLDLRYFTRNALGFPSMRLTSMIRHTSTYLHFLTQLTSRNFNRNKKNRRVSASLLNLVLVIVSVWCVE